jgi:hypothetical protein
MYAGQNVSPLIRNGLSIGAKTPIATAVGTYNLVHILGCYPRIDMNVAIVQTLLHTAPLPMYPTGENVNAYFVSTVSSGATAHNMTYSYTNQAGTA